MLDFNTLKSFLLEKPGAIEEFPFDTDTLVIKGGGKMFALVGIKEEGRDVVVLVS